MKRKWSEEGAAPGSSLFSLSVSKLHQSLQRVEPNLRHLVLVANTLRRFQGEMRPGPAPVLQPPLGQGDPFEGCPLPTALACTLPKPYWRLMVPPSLSPDLGGLALSDGDSPALPALLEDSGSISRPEEEPHQPCWLNPGAGWTPHACRPGSLDLPSPGSYLLEDGLEGVFEDIDTSMYDCDLWVPTSLPDFKEAFCPPREPMPDLADLDCLADVFVGVQER